MKFFGPKTLQERPRTLPDLPQGAPRRPPRQAKIDQNQLSNPLEVSRKRLGRVWEASCRPEAHKSCPEPFQILILKDFGKTFYGFWIDYKDPRFQATYPPPLTTQPQQRGRRQQRQLLILILEYHGSKYVLCPKYFFITKSGRYPTSSSSILDWTGGRKRAPRPTSRNSNIDKQIYYYY